QVQAHGVSWSVRPSHSACVQCWPLPHAAEGSGPNSPGMGVASGRSVVVRLWVTLAPLFADIFILCRTTDTPPPHGRPRPPSRLAVIASLHTECQWADVE